MWKYISSFIWRQNDDDLISAYNFLEKAFEREEEEHIEIDDDDQQSQFRSEQKTGFITNIRNFKYQIDDQYEFTSEKLFVIGSKVSFTLFRDEGNFKVTDVTEIVDEWGNMEHDNVSRTWCMRNITTEVQKRERRMVHTIDNIQIDLNQVSSSFIPFEGDVVVIEAKCEIDDKVLNLSGKILEVLKISPVRVKLISGVVRSFDQRTMTGGLNHDCFFIKESLTKGYMPKVNERVSSEVIESNYKQYSWRCLKLVSKEKLEQSNANQFDDLPKLSTYQHHAEGINISDNIVLNPKSFNDSQTCCITIKNERDIDIILKMVTFEAPLKQTRLVSPVVNKLTISPNCCIELTFRVNPKSYGQSQETILLHFSDIIVARMIYINLDNQLDKPCFSNASVYNARQDEAYNNMRNYTSPANVIRGRGLNPTPRFIGKKRNEWHIPGHLSRLFNKYDDYAQLKAEICSDLRRLKPSLANQLCPNAYEDRFHTLLYLEELQLKMMMRRYDQDRACFITDPNFLILEVENLAESRPSIVIGDRIIATCLQTANNFEGTVHKVSGSHVFLKFSQTFHSTYKGEDYKIHAIASRSNFVKMHQAIYSAKMNISDVLFPTRVFKKKIQVNFTYEPYEDNLKTTLKAETDENDKTDNDNKEEDQIPKVFVEKKVDRLKISKELEVGQSLLRLEWFNTTLNYYQKEAVRSILLGESRPLPYIIFGPPGTGKSVTVIECALQLLRLMPHSRLMIATPSNSAADLICSRLIGCGTLRPGDFVRLISFIRIKENLVPAQILPYCAIPSIAKEDTTENQNQLTDTGYINNMTLSNMIRYRIIIGTCSALGSLQQVDIKKGHFTHVIVDEAGQCTEPEIMIPLSFVDTEGQIILAGDPMQLGPVVLSKEARQFGLAENYLERLIVRFPYMRDVSGFPNTDGFDPKLVTKLLYNYRALPELLQIPNSFFYHRELRATISESKSPEIDDLHRFASILPKTKQGRTPALVFHGIAGVNERTADSPSWINKSEIAQVIFYVHQLYRLGAKKEEFGIITPYIKQVRQIRALIDESDLDMPKIGTVEEFQGQEFKVIIISTVRSNGDLLCTDAKFALGFIASPQRFNVAMTRSRSLTIIIGNPKVLSLDKYWGPVIEYCRRIGSYVGCEPL